MRKIMDILIDERIKELEDRLNFDEDLMKLYDKMVDLEERIEENLKDFELLDEYTMLISELTSRQLRRYYKQGYRDGAGKD